MSWIANRTRTSGSLRLYAFLAAAALLAVLGLRASAAEAAFPGQNGRIAFERTAPLAQGDIWAMEATGLDPVQLTTHAARDANPAYSPDGTKIAFMSERDGDAEIYVMSADGSGQTRLTTNAATDDNPAFSPDGSRIAFESNRDGNTEIYVMDSDGTDAANRTNSPASAEEDPAFAPRGDRIAFRTTRDNAAGEIYVMDASGSNPTRLDRKSVV